MEQNMTDKKADKNTAATMKTRPIFNIVSPLLVELEAVQNIPT